MLGNSWVAAQLVASQEELNSMELVSYLWDMRFSRRGLWTYLSSGMWRRVNWHRFTDVSEESTAPIFYPDGGGSTFLWHIGKCLKDYSVSHPRRFWMLCECVLQIKNILYSIFSAQRAKSEELHPVTGEPTFILVHIYIYAGLRWQIWSATSRYIKWRSLTVARILA
jgi:hypothetical protein